MVKVIFLVIFVLPLLSGCATLGTLAVIGAGAAVVGASANVYRATRSDRVIIVDQSGRPIGRYYRLNGRR